MKTPQPVTPCSRILAKHAAHYQRLHARYRARADTGGRKLALAYLLLSARCLVELQMATRFDGRREPFVDARVQCETTLSEACRRLQQLAPLGDQRVDALGTVLLQLTAAHRALQARAACCSRATLFVAREHC